VEVEGTKDNLTRLAVKIREAIAKALGTGGEENERAFRGMRGGVQ